ncbi:MAG: hypothetical protein GKR91_04870 [Pseudomonadales bacterium]|nr:hypothetical protein [Pseudomonadales bacterium]
MKKFIVMISLIMMMAAPAYSQLDIPDDLQGTLIVLNKQGHDASFIDIGSGEIVRSISTNQNGSHMEAISADGSVAYTSNGAADSVSVIDVTNSRFLRSINVPDRPEAITTNKTGTEIWVGSNDNEVVTVIGAGNDETLAQWDGFDWPYRILLTDDERYAIMPDLNNNNIRFFNARSREELGAIDLSGTRPQGETLYSDDRTLFLSLAGQDRVMVIDIESREILGGYETGSSPDGIAYSPLVLRKTIDYQ